MYWTCYLVNTYIFLVNIFDCKVAYVLCLSGDSVQH